MRTQLVHHLEVVHKLVDIRALLADEKEVSLQLAKHLVDEFEARCHHKDLDPPRFRQNGRGGDTTLLMPFVKKRDDLSLVLDIELEDIVQCSPPIRLLWAGDAPLGDQRVLLEKVARHLIDFCDEVASIDQLDSGLNNEISLAVDKDYLHHVKRREVTKLLSECR